MSLEQAREIEVLKAALEQEKQNNNFIYWMYMEMKKGLSDVSSSYEVIYHWKEEIAGGISAIKIYAKSQSKAVITHFNSVTKDRYIAEQEELKRLDTESDTIRGANHHD